jgi:hypothetical protein
VKLADAGRWCCGEQAPVDLRLADVPGTTPALAVDVAWSTSRVLLGSVSQACQSCQEVDVKRQRQDEEHDVAIALLEAVLGAEVLPAEPCEYGGCHRLGSQYRHGVWCGIHARTMERRPV